MLAKPLTSAQTIILLNRFNGWAERQGWAFMIQTEANNICDGLGLLCSNVRVCSVVGVSMCESLPRGKISNTNEQLDRVWRHSLFQKSGPRA